MYFGDMGKSETANLKGKGCIKKMSGAILGLLKQQMCMIISLDCYNLTPKTLICLG